MNHDKNTFQCFSCEKKGNVLEFTALKENCNLKSAGEKLESWFPSEGGEDTKTITVPKNAIVILIVPP